MNGLLGDALVVFKIQEEQAFQQPPVPACHSEIIYSRMAGYGIQEFLYIHQAFKACALRPKFSKSVRGNIVCVLLIFNDPIDKCMDRRVV